MYVEGLLSSLTRVKKARSLRASSWDTTGKNNDAWNIEPNETRVLADIKGPGCINHIWMTQRDGYRNVLLRVFWDDEEHPSVLCPLGDFFGLGNEIVNSYDSLLFSASTAGNNQFNTGCALNCYVQMPFNKSARIELVNEGDETHRQYFYIDYELYERPLDDDVAYFHTQFRRENPCDGWGHEIRVNTPEANIVNAERLAWNNNYLILEAEGRGHYIGCNLSITNFQGTWWGEGDDMIWVDGYKWPPISTVQVQRIISTKRGACSPTHFDITARQSMSLTPTVIKRRTCFISKIQFDLRKKFVLPLSTDTGTISAMKQSSVAYWYQLEPHKPFGILPIQQRKPVLKAEDGGWLIDEMAQTPQAELMLNDEMEQLKAQWAEKQKAEA